MIATVHLLTIYDPADLNDNNGPDAGRAGGSGSQYGGSSGEGSTEGIGNNRGRGYGPGAAPEGGAGRGMANGSGFSDGRGYGEGTDG